MNMQETTAAFSHVRLGRLEDNDAILEFYASVAMDAGEIDLRYERGPCFFDFLSCQGERGFVIIFERDEPGRRVGGVATISVRACLHEGRETRVAYLADLRLSPRLERRPRLQFRKWYETLVTTARQNTDLGESGLMYSAILDKNRIALQSLVREKGDVLYAPVHRYQGVSVFGRWPWAGLRGRKHSWNLTEQSNFSDALLISFLQKCNRAKMFGYAFPQELEFRKLKWPGLSRHPFLLVKDGQGKTMASALPWDGSSLRQAVIEKIPWRLKVASHMLPLIQGRHVREHDVLKSLYLTHLEFDPDLSANERGLALQMILDSIFCEGRFRGYHMLNFIEHESRPVLAYLKGYYAQCTPATLYQVMDRAEATPCLAPVSALEIATL